MEIDYVAVGAGIRGLRKDRGLSQTELAGITGISPSHMSLIEKGKTSFGLPLLVKISEALETTPGELLSIAAGQNEPRQRAMDQVDKILASCTPEQASLLQGMVHHMKVALVEYRQEQKDQNQQQGDKIE